MKKYLSSLAAVAAITLTPLCAQEMLPTQTDESELPIENTEQYAFGGIGYGYSNSLDKKNLLELRLGMQNSVWRTMFTYENNFDIYQGLLIEVDRTIVAGLMNGKGRIYLGLSGGWVMFSGDRVENDLTVNWKDYGHAYGGNIGFMYYLNAQADLSIGYRYLKVNDICSLESCLKDNLQGFEVALHYFF